MNYLMWSFALLLVAGVVLRVIHHHRTFWWLFLMLLAGSVMLLSTAARAEEPSTADDVIVVVKKGQVAPFDGQLFDNPTALRWGLWIQQAQVRHSIELDAQKQHCTADLSFEREARDIEKERARVLIDDLGKRLKTSEQWRLQLKYEADNPPWYESPFLWLAVGAVTASGVFLVVD